MNKIVLAAAIAALTSTSAFAQGTEAVVGGATSGTVVGQTVLIGGISGTVVAVGAGFLVLAVALSDGSGTTTVVVPVT